jgi:hypothetical protein
VSAEPLRVVYVAGYGHSGSTLLNILLGQVPRVMGAGELFRLAGAAWPKGEFCSCGRTLPTCPVWSEVVHLWSQGVGGDAISSYRRLQQACEGWPAPVAGREVWADYARHTTGLFMAIREVTGRSIVIDSSKLPGRARALARVPGIDLRLVHLVRDGRGVAWSMRRRLARDPQAGVQAAKRARSVLRTGLLWMSTNLAVERTARGLGERRAMRLAYEELVADPALALDRLGGTLGTDLSPLAAQLVVGEPLAAGHVMAGNRLRMDGALRLRADLDWQAQLPVGQRRLFEQLCRPVLRRYGYLAAPAA